MKPSAVLALVAAGVVAGAGVATYELTKPSDTVRVNFVDPASVSTSEPTTATVTVTPTASATMSSTSVAVTSSSTTRKATVQKEATVATTSSSPAPADATPAVTPNAPPVKWGPNGPPPNPSDSPAK